MSLLSIYKCPFLCDKCHIAYFVVFHLPLFADLVNSDARNEAIEAMTALGYSPSEALKAVKQITVTDDMDAGAILKAALKVIR